MGSTYRPVNWVSVDEASELTGRAVSSFYKLMEAGSLVEGTHWKSSEDGQRLFNLEELDNWVANSTSKGSGRANVGQKTAQPLEENFANRIQRDVMDRKESISLAPLPWVTDFRDFERIDAYAAACILAGASPYIAVGDLSDAEVEKVDEFGKAFAAAVRSNQLANARDWDAIVLNPRDIRGALWRYGTLLLAHSDIRVWCHENGFHWPIPEASGTSTREVAQQDTNEGLLRQLTEAEDKRTDAERERDEADAAAEVLRQQVSEMQRAIDELRRIVGNDSAAALHNTGLMKIALQVQRDYWCNPAEAPKQEILISELKEKYGLSQFEASAVERVACPIDRKKTSKN